METTRPRRSVEWPTVMLIGATYLTLALIVWFHAVLPWWVTLPIGSYCAALHVSLQHEVLHGHPTSNRFINELLIFPSVTFWLPYQRYRDMHLIHHNDSNLTDPRLDPESYYLLPDDWAALPGLKRSLYQFNHTLLGRMLIGPVVSIVRMWHADFVEIAKGNRKIRKDWVLFVLAVAITLFYVVGIAQMPLWQYLLLVAYPGISLSLVRSYCEHQASEKVEHRTIIVEASPFWSLLFLNNNLHVAHHTVPSLAWYKIPEYYRNNRERLLAANNSYTMRGYGEIFSRYFLKAKEPIPYPNMSWLRKL